MNPDLPELPKPATFDCQLIENRKLTPTTHHLTFAVPDEFRYASGQFVSLHQTFNGEPIKRAYSVAGPSHPGAFEICLNRVPHGPFSNYLCDLAAGERLRFDGPYGFFVPRLAPRDSLFVATGTGVGPIRSIILDLIQRAAKRPMYLLFGTRAEDTVLYSAEWNALAASEPDFHFLPTLSRPSNGWPGRRGYVQAHLDDFLSRRDMNVYICGLKHMVEDVRLRFKAAGFDRRSIVYERFD